ncbi:hypothetical protein NFI95_07635 [Acetobacteraceae bacterium KSS8]|uniref:Uncharacterized protein n=1 Tax=Endosaccharibacter trunci TaxID=2812733 RepID=A0ABT1W609_9PROT|nr:hypothetical protein [Acetobacteraceae bacterium KSS8]
MVRRHKVEEVVGVIEFEGRTQEDPVLQEWIADHRARNGGKIRLSQGGKGTRVMFSKAADMQFWQSRSDQLEKGRRSA